MAGDGRRAGTASGSAFDQATGVQGGPERWAAEVDPGWTVAGRPNWGYLLALVTRAALESVGQPDPLAVSGTSWPPPTRGRPRWRCAGCGPGAACPRLGPPCSRRARHGWRAGHRRADRPGRGAWVAAGDRAGRDAAGGPVCARPTGDARWHVGRPARPSRPAGGPGHHRVVRRPSGRAAGDAGVGAVRRRARRRPAGPAPGGRRAAPDQLRARPGELGADGRADRLPARRPGARLAGRCRARPALAGRLVRRGRRGLGLGRPPGRPVPPARRRPPARPAGDAEPPP